MTTTPMPRTETFACDGPAQLNVGIGGGHVTIRLAETEQITVEILAVPGEAGWWEQSLTGLITLVRGDGARGSKGVSPWGEGLDDLAAAAVTATEVAFSPDSRGLFVEASRKLELRGVPLAVTITAPLRSTVRVGTGSAPVTVTGTAARLDVSTGSGAVTAEDVEGPASVRTGSGNVRVGPVGGAAQARTGSGAVHLGAVTGQAMARSGSGAIWVGATEGTFTARTGSGDVTVAEAGPGELRLSTGSGAVWVGIRAGVAAQLDLASGGGTARSDLPQAEAPGPDAPVVRISARNGSGEILVTRAQGSGAPGPGKKGAAQPVS